MSYPLSSESDYVKTVDGILVPARGWEPVEVIDLKTDEVIWDSEKEIRDDYIASNCEMCGKEKIRFVHVVRHIECTDTMQVGCVCAGTMTGNKEEARKREGAVKNLDKRREKFITKDWRISHKGNEYTKFEGHRITILKRGISWNAKIAHERGDINTIENKSSVSEVKMAAFNDICRKLKWTRRIEDMTPQEIKFRRSFRKPSLSTKLYDSPVVEKKLPKIIDDDIPL